MDEIERMDYLANLRVELPDNERLVALDEGLAVLTEALEKFRTLPSEQRQMGVLQSVSLNTYPEWEALTEEQREFMLVIANQNYSYEVRSQVRYPLYDRGYIFDAYSSDHEVPIEIYCLTYRGAMIIPRHLVKAKE